MLLKFIAWKFSKKPSFLAILEYCENELDSFLHKINLQAKSYDYKKLSILLEKNAAAKYKHACSLRRLNQTYDWNWDKYNLFEHPLSMKYLGQEFEELSLFNQIACIHTFFYYKTGFYLALLKFIQPQFSDSIVLIINDDINFFLELEIFFKEIIPKSSNQYLKKWKWRAIFTLLKIAWEQAI